MWRCRVEVDTVSKFNPQIITMFHTVVGETKEEVNNEADSWMVGLRKQGYTIFRVSRRTVNMSNGGAHG